MIHPRHQSPRTSARTARSPRAAPSPPPAPPGPLTPRHTVELTAPQAMALLAGAPLGRIVFTRRALPAIRPVNHLLDGGRIVIRTHRDSELFHQARQHGGQGVVVAYQADDIDPLTHLGWSVVATGYCHPVTDPEALLRYQRLIRPWPDRPMEAAVRISPDLVTGVRLTA
ncbi:pyridoxamine 5'-phosphate oxidase family protein [Streptomyces halstedii]|uniref:pyridoxamine 5'-phosphate oxidase family protein n=1 Tax=Streptomyces TaxID=1883 RepID=UPI00048AD6E0|nr:MULTISPECIES: pyridoxamine 5'-phosphate oxidase family protein [Streptomyces]MCW8220950.1 pyridoxamine 5'-phosphate oxidase family protein [Streptomyces griseolus]MYR72789.1 pyridoxamine 5'-phosphate oxidase family protein [Streptomyces sp. SID4925]MYY19699.1 pyridoxamine 5'-phosphate oxidase family protein [Streptomyces sp. SID4912]SBU95364.1 Pyridoxamine 5'-phosphate oxidase [Streptomyces sp. OspMP-M45]SCD47062.1 Pyridoxamine 5'-phosphate oxidase [Streptomyces sp. PpalLS-921]